MSAVDRGPSTRHLAGVGTPVVGLLVLGCVMWLVLVPAAAPVALAVLALLLVVRVVAGVRSRPHE